MIQIYELGKKIQSSDPVVQLGIIPLIGSITSIAFLILKSLGNLKIAQSSALYASGLKKYTHHELLIFSLPLIGSAYLINKLSQEVPQKTSQEEDKQSLASLQKQKERFIEMVKMYLKIQKVQNALRAYILERKKRKDSPPIAIVPQNRSYTYPIKNYKLGLYMLVLLCVTIYLKSCYDAYPFRNLKY